MTKLIVGLGNPGEEHIEDRHNAGFWFVDALAKQLSTRFESEKRFHPLKKLVTCYFLLKLRQLILLLRM